MRDVEQKYYNVKALSKYFGLGLTTCYEFVADMRTKTEFKKSIISIPNRTLVDHEDFERYLRKYKGL